MSSTDKVAMQAEIPPILPPYTPDHDSVGHRRVRTLIVVGVTMFCFFYGVAFALFAPFLVVGLVMPIAAAALVVVWALPDTSNAPTQSLWVGLVALIACLVMWPSYLALALPGLPWITMERLTGGPLALLLVVCTSISQDFRSQAASALKAAPNIWKLLVAFVVIQVISIGLSAQIFQSIDKFIVAQLGWTAVFFTSVYVFLKPGRIERMAGLLWGLAIAVGLIGIQEWRVEHVLWVGHIPKFLQIPDKAVMAALAGGARFGRYRVQSTFPTALGLGEYLALTMPFVLGFAMGPYRWPLRSAAAASAVFIMFIAIICGARVGTVGCLTAITLSVAAWSVLKWRREPDSLIGPAVALAYPALAAALIAGVAFIGRLRSMVWGDGSEQYSTDARMTQWQLGIPKILSHPQGYGIGMGGSALGYHPNGFLSIDNYYLDIALDYGIVGFILYYGMFFAAIYYSIRARMQIKTDSGEFWTLTPMAISLIVFIMIKSSFSEQNNHPIVFMILGMVAALSYRASTAGQAGLNQPPMVDAHAAPRTPAWGKFQAPAR